MDKNNKYYAIIEELVKNHRKFQGLDDLLDEIIDDVYAHSEVIINTVDNEAVVKSYLEKVISTSIITVPKKLKRTTRSNKVSSSISDILTSPSNNDIKVNTELVDKMINTKEPVLENDDISDDSLLNSIAESTPTIVNEITEEISEVNFTDNLDDIDISEEIIHEEQIEENVDNNENIETLDLIFEPKNDSVIDTEMNEEQDSIANENEEIEVIENDVDSSEKEQTEILQTEELTEDKNTESEDIAPDTIEELEVIDSNEETVPIVDIDSAKDDVLTENDNEILEIEEDIYYEANAVEDNKEEAIEEEEITSVVEEEIAEEENLTEDSSTVDNIEESLYQTSENDLLAPFPEENLLSNEEEALVAEESENSIIEEINPTEQTVDSIELEESVEDDLTDTIDNEDLVEDLNSSDTFGDELELDESISDDIVEGIGQLESFENDEIETFELNTDDDLLPDNEVLQDDFSSELEDINSEDDLLIEEPGVEENAEAHIDYSVFDYTPDVENETIDSRAILSEIKNLDERRPNLNIKRIFELKYKNNMKISQIAEELGCEQSQVIEALKEIVDVV